MRLYSFKIQLITAKYNILFRWIPGNTLFELKAWSIINVAISSLLIRIYDTDEKFPIIKR